MNIDVRPARERDVTELLNLYQELNPRHAFPSLERAREIWQKIAHQDGRTIFVAEDNNDVIGTVDCIVLPNLAAEGKGIMFLENVVVKSTYKRRGVGALLIDKARDLAVTTNCYKIQLLSSDKDEANSFYNSVGFNYTATGFRLYPNDK